MIPPCWRCQPDVAPASIVAVYATISSPCRRENMTPIDGYGLGVNAEHL